MIGYENQNRFAVRLQEHQCLSNEQYILDHRGRLARFWLNGAVIH